MGYSSPQSVFGWYATTNQLAHDATDYDTNSTSYVLKKTFQQIEPITGYLRVQYDIRDTLAGTCYSQLCYWDGATETVIATDSTPAVLATVTHDISPSWTKGGEIRLYIKTGSGEAHISNIYLLGERSPFIEV